MKLNILAALAAIITATFTISTTPALAGQDMENGQVQELPPIILETPGVAIGPAPKIMVVGADLSKQAGTPLFPAVGLPANQRVASGGYLTVNYVSGIPFEDERGESSIRYEYIYGNGAGFSVNRKLLCAEARRSEAKYILLLTKTSADAAISHRRETTEIEGAKVKVFGTRIEGNGGGTTETGKLVITLEAELIDLYGNTVIINQQGRWVVAHRSLSRERYRQDKDRGFNIQIGRRGPTIRRQTEITSSNDDPIGFMKKLAEDLLAGFPLPAAGS